MVITSYRATPAQTKPACRSNHECTTSTGENVSELGVAASQDLLKSGAVKYGDVLYIPGVGTRIVNDTTNARLRRTIDVFVYSKAEEKAFGVKHLTVYKLEVVK